MPSLCEPVVRRRAPRTRVTPGRDDRERVVRARPQRLRAADRERLVGAVDHRGLRPGGADVGRSRPVRHERDEPLGADRVARVQHRAVGHRPHHREIFQRHLRRAVLADRHAGVRPGHLDADLADARHADEVGRARQETREGRRKREWPRAPRTPSTAPTITCSAMKHWKKRSGNAFSNRSLNVEFFTSASRATTRASARPSAAMAVPNASRVATWSPSL